MSKLSQKDVDPNGVEFKNVYNKVNILFNSIVNSIVNFDTSKFLSSVSESMSEEALIGLGNLHRKNGRYEDAVEAYEEAIRRYPDSALARNELAWLYINDLQDNKNCNSEALKLAKEAVAISREAAFLDTIAMCHLQYGEFEEAEALLKEAKDKPNVPEYGQRFTENHLKEVQARQQQQQKK